MSVAGVRKNAQYILDKLSLDTKLQVFYLERDAHFHNRD